MTFDCIFSDVMSLLFEDCIARTRWGKYSVFCLVLQNKEEYVPLSNVAMIPSGVPSHQHIPPGDGAKYRQKYKKLKQLVKETVFVSGKFFYSIIIRYWSL